MKSREYRCPICGERFKKGNKLEKHVKKEHGFDVAAKTCEIQKPKNSERTENGASW